MKRQGVFALTILAALMVTMSASAAPPDEQAVRRMAQENYAKGVAAYKQKDARAWAALFAPDAKVREWDGKSLDRKGLEAWAKQDMAETQDITSARLVIEKATLHGAELTQEGTEIWKFKFVDLRGQYGPKGKAYQAVWKQRSRATLVKTDKGWLIKRLEFLNEPSLTVGGKPLRPLAEKKP